MKFLIDVLDGVLHTMCKLEIGILAISYRVVKVVTKSSAYMPEISKAACYFWLG